MMDSDGFKVIVRTKEFGKYVKVTLGDELSVTLTPDNPLKLKIGMSNHVLYLKVKPTAENAKVIGSLFQQLLERVEEMQQIAEKETARLAQSVQYHPTGLPYAVNADPIGMVDLVDVNDVRHIQITPNGQLLAKPHDTGCDCWLCKPQASKYYGTSLGPDDEAV